MYGVSSSFGHPPNFGSFEPKCAGPTLKPAWNIPKAWLAYSQLGVGQAQLPLGQWPSMSAMPANLSWRAQLLVGRLHWSQLTPFWLLWGVSTYFTLLPIPALSNNMTVGYFSDKGACWSLTKWFGIAHWPRAWAGPSRTWLCAKFCSLAYWAHSV